MIKNKKDTSTKKSKIQVIDLHKSFGKNHVLRGINFEIEEGESLVVLGGSGSGKSVLLKCVIGLLTPDKGQILIDGKDVLKMNTRQRDEVRHKFGMLFQGAALFDSLTVWRNIGFELLYNQKLPAEKVQRIVRQKLKAVGLGDRVMELSPAELSGGMQKRVGLARAIASNPEIIFFDEPTTGLDPIMCGVIDKLIVQSLRDLNACGITITHDIATARFVADKIAMLKEGKLVWTGKSSDLKKTKNSIVKEFINGHVHKTDNSSIKASKASKKALEVATKRREQTK
ncbi:MAG: ATP-binding cassette domain-containing protein [Holosporaceae bacterium]|nr:MAG: ATP-binding cassette domain-containing protein [Holosporaceae bacterium]